jgi:hypothetical protein
MGLKELVEKRVNSIELVPIKGGTLVRVLRMSREDILEMPQDGGMIEQVRRTILKDELDEPFYTDATSLCRDGVLYFELVAASNKINGLDTEAAEKK